MATFLKFGHIIQRKTNAYFVQTHCCTIVGTGQVVIVLLLTTIIKETTFLSCHYRHT